MDRTLLKKVYNYDEGKGLAAHFRSKRASIFTEFFDRNFPNASMEPVHILDLGGTERFWRSVGFDVLRARNIRISLLNIRSASAENTDIFTPIKGDARFVGAELAKAHDLCFSNSCIEHVGQMRDIVHFRDSVAQFPCYFVQTPNYWFPVESHFFFPFFKQLPKSIRLALLRHFSLGHFPKQGNVIDALIADESVYLLTHNLFSALFPDAHIAREKAFWMTKSFIAMKDRAKLLR